MKIQNLFFLLVFLTFSFLASAETAPECKKIVFGGTEIGCLVNGVGPFTTDERIKGIEQRLVRIAADATFDPIHIIVLNNPDNTEIVAGETVITYLQDSDLSATSDLSRAQFAQGWADRMREGVLKYRELRSPEELTWSVGYTLLATLGLAFLLKLFSFVANKTRTFIESKASQKINSLKIKDHEFLSTVRIISVLQWTVRAIRIALTLLVIYTYIPLVFSFYSVTANWTPKLYGYIKTPLITLLDVVINYIPNLFFVIIIAVCAHYFVKLIKLFFVEIENGHIRFDGFFKDWAQPTYKLVRILIFISAFIMAFPYLPGSSSPAFQGVSVFIGVLVSLGSSSAVANVVAGIVLTYMRPFKIGDRVKISETMGDVIEKTLLVTRIRTIKNVDITIPNSMVLGSHIINYSSTAEEEGLILNTTVTIGYDAPWRQVHELLKAAAKQTDLILQDKEPFILQTALNDFYVSYELNAYTKSASKMAKIYSDLHTNIQETFNAAGVEIMSPHYSALRDGNEVTIPANQRSNDYVVPSFRVKS